MIIYHVDIITHTDNDWHFVFDYPPSLEDINKVLEEEDAEFDLFDSDAVDYHNIQIIRVRTK